MKVLDILMKSKKATRHYWIVSIVIIFLLSFALRVERTNSVWYIDELIYVKLTRFISDGHLASSSSLYNIYQAHNSTLSWGVEKEIVEPWLDHPALFSVLALPLWFIGFPRLLPVLLGSMSTLLIIYLMRERRFEAVLSGLIFSFYPFAVQLNAMFFLDNGSSFFLLLTMALTSKYEKDRSGSFLVLAGISAGFSFLCKEYGMYSILYLLLYLLSTRKMLRDYKALILAIGIASTYFAIGLFLNKDLFIDIVTRQVGVTSGLTETSGRSVLNTAIMEFSFDLNGFKMEDISLLLFLSWICLGALLRSEKNRIIKLGILSLLLTLVVIRYFWFYTWIAVYPFFSIAIAHVVYEALLPVSKYARAPRSHLTLSQFNPETIL